MYDLRPVTEADWPLWQDLFRVFEDNIRAMNSSWSPVHQQDYARTAFDRSRDVKSVVLKGGQTAGLCAYSWEPDRSLYLSDLIVAPDYRNAGLGAKRYFRQLMKVETFFCIIKTMKFYNYFKNFYDFSADFLHLRDFRGGTNAEFYCAA